MSIRIPTPIVPVCEKDQPLFKSVNAFVHGYMSQPGHDNSHDYDHILRVVSNANRLLETELKSNPSQTYDITALFLAALLHDVGDHKYAKPGEDLENQISALLKERGASDELATKVQVMVKNVSYSNESKHPESVVDVLCKYPELAIVQDSDRLDAIGAVGVGRCFAYTGAKCQGEPMSRAIDHFSEKLYKLAGMMKTVSGRELAASRTKLLQQFAEEFNKEAGLSFALE